MRAIVVFFILVTSLNLTFSQSDTLYPKRLAKIHHAEPLYVDLVRDLGARKGEHEINVGWGMNNKGDYVSNNGFVEYEFAPINRLGVEV